jgi:hypothetical protein
MSGIVSTAELRSQGLTKRAIAAAVHRGSLEPIIRGWFATPIAHPDAVRAIRLGARAGCVSALSVAGAWVPPDAGLHVVMPAHASGRRLAIAVPSDVTVHWHGPLEPTGSRFAVSPVETSIRHLVDCQPPRFAVAVLDSLLHRRVLARNRLVSVLAGTSGSGRAVIPFLDERSESGIESIARYGLAAAGIPSEPQVVVPGIGRVDLLVDGWLAVELDGREFHAQEAAFVKDRRRTNLLQRGGRIVLQFDYATVVYDWPFVEETVRSVLAQFAPVR